MHGRTSVLPFAILALVARIASLIARIRRSRIVRGKPVHANSGTAGLQVLGRPRSIRWLVLYGVALIGAIAIGTALALEHFRERAMADSKRELGNTALLLGRYLDEQFEELALAQTNLIDQMGRDGIASPENLERRMSGQDAHLTLKSHINALPHVNGLSLINANGKLINSSYSWPVQSASVADRAYFKALKSDSRLTTVVSDPVHSRITGKWTIIVARKITGPGGEFLGLVLGGIALDYFEQFFASVTLADGAAINMFNRDATLLARHPRVDSLIGREFPTYRDLLSKADRGTTRLSNSVDGHDRLVSARALTQFPIVIVAATTVSAALTVWRQQTRLLLGVAGVLALVIAGIMLLIVRQLSGEHEASQRRLTLEKQRLDTAVNNMAQGLLLFDASERIVVVNQRYIEMYRLSPDVVKPGCTFRDLIAHRKETGSFAGDVANYCSSMLRSIAEGRTSQVVTHATDGRSIQVTQRPLASGGWVATHEDITERRRSEAKILHMARHDVLTNLPNRVLLGEQLEKALMRVKAGEKLALHFIDLDHFKTANDTLGHAVGDKLLQAVADRLRQIARKSETIARLGGDEFAVVQVNMEGLEEVMYLAQALIAAISEPYDIDGHQIIVGASIGIALAPADGDTADQLLRNADLALYRAKDNGRATYHFFECGLDQRMQRRRALEGDLRKAVTSGQFELHYQPLVSVDKTEVVGAEALIRWRHPERGTIPPADFIALAEETGLIVPIGEWVIRQACATAARWPNQVRVAVNLSTVQFRKPGLLQTVANALAAAQLAPHRLELEVTESLLLEASESVVSTLHQLRSLGVKIALDDFGTGYSSLSYLQSFPFDKIKIDRSFVKDIGITQSSAHIVQAMVTLAQALDMSVTAEGVETEAQLAVLRDNGCTEAQGYLFSPPIPAEDIERLFLSAAQICEDAA